MRRLIALILSVLALTISAGVGETLSALANKTEMGIDDGENCCCGCCGDEGNAPQKKTPNSCHKGCPFCITNTCPGFAAVYFTELVRSFSEDNAQDYIFIAKRYIQPFVDGVWQPPWIV